MKSNFNIDLSILIGSELRTLLNSEHISYGEIHSLLKMKGIFVGDPEKSTTVPLLISTLLTPDEFNNLTDLSISREARPKFKAADLDLSDPDADWITPLKELIEAENFLSLVGLENVTLESPLQVVVINDKKISISYSLIRRDFSRDWTERELKFSGDITIERRGSTLKLDLNSTHSSKETEILNKRIMARSSQTLKSGGIVLKEDPNQIRFSSFKNTERVRFFKRLTSGTAKSLSTGDVNDIEISRDMEEGNLPPDPKVEWLNQPIKKIRIDGDRLNDVFLISEEIYYRFYHILRMDIIYSFAFGANTGKCRICFSFSSSSRANSSKKDSELIFEIIKIEYDNHVNIDSKREISLNINKAVRLLIDEKYQLCLKEQSAAIAAFKNAGLSLVK